MLERDSNYYAVVTCDLSNQTVAGDTGEPQLPALSYVYSLPQGYEVSAVSINSRTYTLLSNLQDLVAPVQTPWKTLIGEPQPPFVPPNQTYSQPVYPGDSEVITCQEPLQFSFGMGAAIIRIRPVEYRIPQSELWLITDISFTIHLTAATRTPVLAYRRSAYAQKVVVNYLKGLVQNPSSVDGNLPTPVINTYNYPVNPFDIPPDYVIVTSEAFANELGALKTWQTAHGNRAEIYTLETDIYPNSPGVDDAAKLRNFIIDKYREGALYVLLAGNRFVVPLRHVSLYDRSGPPPHIRHLVPCDLYYADVDGDWDYDGDGVWGEPGHDSADIFADIFVGRVAISRADDAIIWLDKLDRYCDNPGNGDPAYLSNVIISSADQMADTDQPQRIGEEFSDFFFVDTQRFREQPSGGDPNPTSPYGIEIQNYMSSPTAGYWISLHHASPDYFNMMSVGYNLVGISSYSSLILPGGEAHWGRSRYVQNQGREYIHSSIGCGLGAIDCDDDSIYRRDTAYAQSDLVIDGGCVAGTFNTRDGYCYSSWRIEKRRIHDLCSEYYGHRLGLCHYAAKTYFPGLLYLVYNNTFFGDPSMAVWTDAPRRFLIDRPISIYRDLLQTVTIRVRDSLTQIGIADVLVTLSKGDEVYGRGFTDVTGRVYIAVKPDTEGQLNVVAARPNFISARETIQVTTYCDSAVAGDANGNGVCQPSDVTFLVNYFKGLGPHPPDSCMCSDSAQFLYHAGDANGNCVCSGADASYLTAWFKGTGSPPRFCAGCPASGLLLARLNVIPTIRKNGLQ